MTDIQQGLLIAGIGMGLVFVLIMLLWLLMDLMMRLTSREKHAKGEDEDAVETPSVPDIKGVESQRRAVAAGVAVAMLISSSQQQKTDRKLKKDRTEISPWLSYHRARQLDNKK